MKLAVEKGHTAICNKVGIDGLATPPILSNPEVDLRQTARTRRIRGSADSTVPMAIGGTASAQGFILVA
jgi:hypothetical protein